ncbi:MAG: hypothetical protein K2N51_19605, partial [Lachnospiraceae bacterium]|nr:hypothetical protein [Lachnospiraceae bacterium]
MIITTEKYKEQGLFKNYSREHIVIKYLQGRMLKCSINSSKEFPNGIYETVMLNFEKNLHYLGVNLDETFLKIIFGEYLACKESYTNKEFFIRYFNVILFCGLFSIINKPK